jgi:hypothetical protein
MTRSVRNMSKKDGHRPGVGRCPAVSSEDVMGYARADRRYNGCQSSLFPIKKPPESKKARQARLKAA